MKTNFESNKKTMSWEINAACYRKVYNYLIRRRADVDHRFFNRISHRFEIIYKKLNNHSHSTKFQKVQPFSTYLTPQLIAECNTLIQLIPPCKKDQYLNELKKYLDCSITGKICLKKTYEYQKRWIIRAKTQAIYCYLEQYCQGVINKGVDWDLKLFKNRNKPMYIIPTESLDFFTSKIIQQRLKCEYSLNIASRNSIINGVVENLSDHLPKSIIRTDIVEFYESIDSARLVYRLCDDRYIPVDQLLAIKRLLYKHKVIVGRDKGLPRGNGISAYLAEVLLKDFDTFAKRLNEVIYYARFVDDIILIVKEDDVCTSINAQNVWKKLNEKISELSLQLHPLGQKSSIGNTNPNCSFEYLGYNFTVNKNLLSIGIADSKIRRYKDKISLAVWAFFKDRDSSLGKRATLLRNRLRYLTLETRLSGIKMGIQVGLSATYPMLTDFSALEELDSYLDNQRKKLPKQCLDKLKVCSFKDGYLSGRRTHFKMSELKRIVSVWRGV